MPLGATEEVLGNPSPVRNDPGKPKLDTLNPAAILAVPGKHVALCRSGKGHEAQGMSLSKRQNEVALWQRLSPRMKEHAVPKPLFVWRDRAGLGRNVFVVVARQDAWGRPQPHSVPMLSMDLCSFEKVQVNAALAEDEEVVG